MTRRPMILSRQPRARSESRQLWALCVATALVLPLTACEEGATDTEPAPPQVVSVTVSPDTQDIFTIGGTAQLSATALGDNNREIADTDFSWSSSNTQVATVSSDGMVTGVASG